MACSDMSDMVIASSLLFTKEGSVLPMSCVAIVTIREYRFMDGVEGSLFEVGWIWDYVLPKRIMICAKSSLAIDFQADEIRSESFDRHDTSRCFSLFRIHPKIGQQVFITCPGSFNLKVNSGVSKRRIFSFPSAENHLILTRGPNLTIPQHPRQLGFADIVLNYRLFQLAARMPTVSDVATEMDVDDEPLVCYHTYHF